MKAPLVIIGTLLIIASVMIMGLFIVGPAIAPSLDDVPPMKAILQSALCHGGETLTAKYSEFSRPGRYTRNIQMACVNNENQARDVSGQAILFGVVGYLIPFLIGLFMVIIGANTGGRRRVVMTTSGNMMAINDMFGQQGQGMSFDNAGYQVNIDPSGKVEVRTPDGQVYSGQRGSGMAGISGMTSGLAASITARLQQLKTMYDAGLITESDYEQKKQEILKQL